MAYREMWEIEIRHEGLNKYRKIRGSEKYVVEQKAEMQRREWDEMWQRRKEREEATKNIEESKQLAIAYTKEAEENLRNLDNILVSYLNTPASVNWEKLKDRSSFGKTSPRKQSPARAADETISIEPQNTEPKYKPKFGLLDYILTSRKQQKIEKSTKKYEKDHLEWEQVKAEILKRNEEREQRYQKQIIEAEEKYIQQTAQWEAEKLAFENKQNEDHAKIDKRKDAYTSGQEDGIKDLIELVLSKSDYPASFSQEFEIDVKPEAKIGVIDYILPNLEHLPTLKEVKYIQARDEFKETHLSENTILKMYDDLLYKITLRSIREIYDADSCGHVQSVVFNGWINAIDKATGQEVNACILTVQANRDEFTAINLNLVEPKTCFKKLKGVGSSKLHTLTPVAPLLKINRDDPRFVSSYQVADTLDDTINLAAMDWQDFEHLIREIFEKEFGQSGGEVKITRASRDGGVDAVVFDPDPIRGGKIVIQAKRYTNTVGVSAVRDLYGTVVNEGAIKGILVSTADYGPDAYSFAKDKPMTLLDGGNLLHLLGKHGHKAKIDLKEAKALLAEQR